MKRKVIVSVTLVFIAAFSFLLLVNKSTRQQLPHNEFSEENEENEENEAAYHYLRWKYEADMVKDPTTGEALFGLRDQEIEFAKTIPQRNTSSALARLTIQNNYLPAGPNNQWWQNKSSCI